MDNKLMFGILGLVTGVALIANNVNNRYSEDDYETDSDNEVVNESFSKKSHESFCNSRFSSSSIPSNYGNGNIDKKIPLISNDLRDASPLEFGTMIDDGQTIENFSQPIYNTLQSGYNISDDNTPLPVSDMTSTENEKAIYDRIVGSIGFTTTKLGGRNKVGDPIRGDIPIIPDFNPTFQVSARPQDQLTVGAMQINNGISSSTSSSNSSAAYSLGSGQKRPETLQSLRAKQDQWNDPNRQHALGSKPPYEIDIHDLIAAGQNSARQYTLQTGVNTGLDNTMSESFYR
jgi:hypothetical protein